MDRESKSWILTVGKVITGIVYAIMVVYLVILTLAFFLRLFGANPAAGFAEWVYTAAGRIMEPFRGIFPTHAIGDTAVFDASLLFAIIVYSIVALVLHSLISWFTVRLAKIHYEEERDRYLAAQQAAAGAVPPAGAVPAAGAVPPAGAVSPPGAAAPPAGTVAPPPGAGPPGDPCVR
jgi:uncharacterized protein YggT (Ycf19 family)